MMASSQQPLIHMSESSLKTVRTQNVHKWTIENFEQRFSNVKVKKPETNIQSAPFSVFDGEKAHTFQMYIDKQGDQEGVEVDKMVSVWLTRISKDPVDMFFHISLNNLFENKTWKWNKKRSFLIKNQGFGFKNFMEVRKLRLVNGTLILFANMETQRLTSLDEEELPPELPDKGLVLERTKLAEFSDFTLICGKSEFKVHKVVLVSSCNFFEGMFRHNCIELNTNEMKVVDIDPKTLEQMIELMYTRQSDSLPSDEALLLKLLEAADKYGFEFLLNCLERKLIKDVLGVESSAYWLKSALRFNASHLQAKAKKLLCANLAQIRKTVEFAHLMMEFPDCLLDEN